MIRLSELDTPGVALEWHEAVAVIAAFTDAVWSARLPRAPTLESAVLTAQGEVLLLGGAHEAGSLTSGLACGLAALLASTPCPAELRRIVVDSTGASPTITSAQDFGHALVFFERPSRQDVLSDLAARAAAPVAQAHTRDEMERLSARARLSGASVHRPAWVTPATPDPPALPPALPPARRLAARAAVAVMVFAAVALVAATLFSTAPPDAALPPAVDASADEDVAGAGARVTPTPPVEPPIVPAARPQGPRAATVPRAPEARLAAPVAASDTSREPDVVVSVTEMGGAPLAAEVTTPGLEPARAGGPTHVYSSADAGVTPAALVKPHLPAEPPSDVPASEVGTLELTVGPTGAVERVHLISPRNRFQERMLVAAAKAWRFQPATKDGRPVRFRTRIRVTL